MRAIGVAIEDRRQQTESPFGVAAGGSRPEVPGRVTVLGLSADRANKALIVLVQALQVFRP